MATFGLLVLLAVTTLELGTYVLKRATSGLRAVSTTERQLVTEPHFSGSVKIVTYNICRGRGNDSNSWPVDNRSAMEQRLREIAEMLVAEAADIVVLNEVDFDSLCSGRADQAQFIADRAEFPFCVKQRNVDAATLLAYSEQTGNAVLSRYPVRQARFLPFPGYCRWQTIMGGKSNAVLCDIAISDELTIRLLATHLESASASVRVESARIIEQERLASPLPFLVVGDLNATAKGFPNADADALNAMSLLLAGGGYTTSPLHDPTPADLTIVVGNPFKLVDWVLVPPSWTIVSRKVLPLSASDHCAVVLEVRPPANRSASGAPRFLDTGVGRGGERRR